MRARGISQLEAGTDAGTDVMVQEPAIWVRRGPTPLMPRSHRHDDLELNFVARGRLDYLFGGSSLRVDAGEIALFWAATPHRLIDRNSDDEVGDNYWVHIPLATVFGWGLPAVDLGDLLTSRPIVLPGATAGRDLESTFSSWLTDLDGGETEEFALLEIQALVRRLLHFHVTHDAGTMPEHSAHTTAMTHVAEMAQFAVGNFRADISSSDIARVTHLNANYAMTLFRETMGSSLGEYLTRCRVAEARRLLLTTTMTTSEVAATAGFGSQSSFYAHFTRACGVSPSAYRRQYR